MNSYRNRILIYLLLPLFVILLSWMGFIFFGEGNRPPPLAILFVFLPATIVAFYIAFRLNRDFHRPLLLLRRSAKDFPVRIEFVRRKFHLPEIQETAEIFVRFTDTIRQKMRSLELEGDLLRSLLDAFQEGVFCLDNEGKIVFVNRSIHPDLLNPTAAGQHYAKVIRNADVLEFVQKVLQHGCGERKEQKRDHQTGDETEIENENHHPFRQQDRHYRIRCANVRPGTSEAMFLFVIEDKTEMFNVERLRQDFLLNASHELKTPITSIRGYSETLAGRIKEELPRSFLEAILRNVRRMERLIEDMVVISRVEGDEYPFRPERIETTIYLERIRELVGGALGKKEQKLELDLQNKREFYGDPLLLEHVLLNLIMNASRHSPTGEIVRLVARSTPSGGGRLEVHDNGPGVPEEYRYRIFERFFRADKNRSREEGGTGLGLSIVRRIVRLHGGSVGVSRAASGGALFWVELPPPSVQKETVFN